MGRQHDTNDIRADLAERAIHSAQLAGACLRRREGRARPVERAFLEYRAVDVGASREALLSHVSQEAIQTMSVAKL